MERPRIKIPLTTADTIAEIAGWLILTASWVMTVISYPDLPSTIPSHYNLAGEVDGYGSKITILILPILGSVIFTGLTIVNRFPHVFNYPGVVTEENAVKHYTNATRMIRYLKLVIVFAFGLIELKTILTVSGHPVWLGIWFTPVILVIILIPTIYFVVRMVRVK